MDLVVDFSKLRNIVPHCQENEPRASFAAYREVRFVEDLSLEYKGDLWFSEHEMDSFKLQAVAAIQQLVDNGMTAAQLAAPNADGTSAFLGLERFLTRALALDVRMRRRAVTGAVLLEQRRQRDAGVDDPEALAALARAGSDPCRRRARIIGLFHED